MMLRTRWPILAAFRSRRTSATPSAPAFDIRLCRAPGWRFGGSYGSGLPTEFDGTIQDAIQQFGQQIVDRVNFDRGRVRPSLSLGVSVGAELVRREHLLMRLQADVQNFNNRLNVINFAGLFSGTGIGPPRSYAVRLGIEF